MKAIIAGVTGAVGSAIARELASSGDWAIAGLSRNPPKSPIAGAEYVRADLADAGQCQRALGGHEDATHLFYCGRATHREQTLERPQPCLVARGLRRGQPRAGLRARSASTTGRTARSGCSR